MSYDRSNVSPTPWKRSGFGRIEDADEQTINYLKNAVGGFPVNDLVNQLHVIHCVNLEATLRERVEALRVETESHKNATRGITTQQLYAYELAAYEKILAILDELEATP